MESCTVFCRTLRRLADRSDAPPTREALIAQLHASDIELASGWSLGTWDDLQTRQCPFCHLAVTAILENVTDPSSINPNQAIDLVLFPEENALRLSYPSRLGTTLAFVARYREQATSPDNARLMTESALLPAVISGWLRKCDQDHDDCLSGGQKNYLCTSLSRVPNESDLICDFPHGRTSNFRVIDLEERCIRLAPLCARYVTLSYVWGQIPMFRLKQSNVEELSAPGSLDAILSKLPGTITDSIRLVKRLGERYLWIDAMCLVQDDVADMSLGIELMSSIYKCSYFTLVIATGNDGNAGIPVFTESQSSGRSQAIQELIPGRLAMTVLHSIDWHLERSTYSQRGWTLQELVLPQRTIIFINNQVYFRCHKVNWSEETWADKWESWLDPDDSNISRLPGVHDERLWFFWTYQKLCEDYSRRKLSHHGDALSAIAGICRPLFDGMGTYGVEGLPKRFLHVLLLFISSDGNMSPRPEFASYSWAGWEGTIMWPRENYVWYDKGQGIWDMENMTRWLRKNRLVKWRVIRKQETLPGPDSREMKGTSIFQNLLGKQTSSLTRATLSDDGSQDETDKGGDASKSVFHRSYALDEPQSHIDHHHLVNRYSGNEDKRMKFLLRNREASRRYCRKLRLRQRVENTNSSVSITSSLERTHYDIRRIVTENDQSTTYVRKASKASEFQTSGSKKTKAAEDGSSKTSAISNSKPYPILQFATIVLSLALGERPSSWNMLHRETGSNNISVYYRIEGIPLLCADGTVAGSLHPDNMNDVGSAGDIIELVVVARCQTPTVGSALWNQSVPHLVPAAADNEPWDLLWVLQITWIDGIAERRGVGQISTASLNHALEPPEVKHILLG